MSEKPTYAQLVQRVQELENLNSCQPGPPLNDGDASQSETFCRQLVETLSEQICRFRPDGTLTFANPAFCNFFGVAWENLSGESIFTLLVAEDHAAVREHLATFSYRQPIAEQERRAISKDGNIIWLQCSDCALFDDDRQVIGFQSVGRDVTQRKKAEVALRQSEAKYHGILDAMQDAVYICSQDYRIEFMNRAMVSLLGKDATGEVCFREIFGQDEECQWCTLDQVVGGEHEDYELRHPANGRCYSVATTAIEYHRNAVSYLAILRDMTEFKKMQDHLRQTQKMASLARLAGGIAHDFNNILAAISGYTELLTVQIPPHSEAGRNLEQVLIACQRAKRLVHQIIQFIRPDHTIGHACDPVTVVTDALSFMRSSMPTSIDFQAKLNSSQAIAMAPEQLSQVVVNLCTNAAHAMEEKGGVIKVTLADLSLDAPAITDFIDLTPGQYVELKVVDDGHGMEAETLKMIFDPYYSTKERSKGIGLGLSIVHGIVEACKGAIKVDSRPGRGAAFRILVPAAAAAAEPASPQGEISFKAICKIEDAILFVDDEPALAELGRKRLEKFGCRVVAETDPMVALDKFKERPEDFRLVITDMTMPKMTGDKFAAALIAIRPDIPIVLCTGFNHRIDEEASKRLGIRAFLTKPVDIDVLIDVVNRVLQQGE